MQATRHPIWPVGCKFSNTVECEGKQDFSTRSTLVLMIYQHFFPKDIMCLSPIAVCVNISFHETNQLLKDNQEIPLARSCHNK